MRRSGNSAFVVGRAERPLLPAWMRDRTSMKAPGARRRRGSGAGSGRAVVRCGRPSRLSDRAAGAGGSVGGSAGRGRCRLGSASGTGGGSAHGLDLARSLARPSARLLARRPASGDSAEVGASAVDRGSVGRGASGRHLAGRPRRHVRLDAASRRWVRPDLRRTDRGSGRTSVRLPGEVPAGAARASGSRPPGDR